MEETKSLLVKALFLSVLIFAISVETAYSQDKSPRVPIAPFNLNGDFETGESGEKPSQWLFDDRFGTAILTDENPHRDAFCCHVSAFKDAKFPANLRQVVDAKSFVGKRIRLKAFIRTNGSRRVQLWMRIEKKVVDEQNLGQIFHEQASKRRAKNPQWAPREIVGDVLEGSGRIWLGAHMMGEGDFWIDDVTIEVVDKDMKVTPSSDISSLRNLFKQQVDLLSSKPGIYYVTGSRDLSFRDRRSATIRTPLPLSYRDQVPISYQYTVEPESAIKSISIEKDKLDNYVAKVVVKPVNGETKIKLVFKSTILVAPSDFVLPKKEIAMPQVWPAEAEPWLEATWCADSNNERIVEIGEEILDETRDVLQIIKAVQKRVLKIKRAATGRVKHLTAVEALDHRGSCTSNANLVAALLRACNVPARVLAGYPSWSGPLQTHYIVEAYVPDFGWYPIESTMLRSPWPNSGQVNVSIVPVEYESKLLAGRRIPNAGGVPYLSLTEQEGNHFWTRGTIEGKPGCDHVCEVANLIEAESVQWKAAIKTAKTDWQQWLNKQTEPVQNNLLFGTHGHRSDIESLDDLK